MTVVAIIPARGGSKGVPGKNLRPMLGKPLLVHTVEQARQSKTLDHIYVSTDNEEIARVATESGASVIERPVHLSGDGASSESALVHALDLHWAKNGADPDVVVFLQCTSPLRDAGDIDEALTQMAATDSDSMLSVTPSHRFFWNQTADGPVPVNYQVQSRPLRQDMAPQFMENGSLYLFKPWVLRKTGSRLGGRIALFVMPPEASLEIDSELDFRLVEEMMRLRSANAH